MKQKRNSVKIKKLYNQLKKLNGTNPEMERKIKLKIQTLENTKTGKR